ncbi:MAG: adenylate/guanylate cyclase domain-containing protein [Betaproteobacteria bacterium]
MQISEIVRSWWTPTFRHSVLLLAVAILQFSFLLRVPTADQAVLGVLERLSFDLQMKFMRAVYPRTAPVEPVLIGIDESAEESFDEPIAMWHKHFAKLLDAMVVAKPAVVGMDVVLPSRSFDHILPGLDLSFLRSLARIKASVPFVVVHTFDRTGKLLPIHDTFHRILGDESFALDKVLEDKDRAARRFNELETVGEGSLPSFSGRMTRLLGREVTAGYIDFSVGSVVDYIPIQKVLTMHANGEIAELKRMFEGKVVLIGYVGGGQDRWNMPIALSSWERRNGELQTNQPGIIVHLQTLRSLLGDGLITPIPDVMKWSICILLLTFVFLPSNRKTYWFAFLIAPILFFAISVILITVKVLIPAVTFLVLLWISVMVGAIADGTRTLMEKNRLKQSFRGSVSPAVLNEIMLGNLAGGVSAKSAEVCVMFSDIRGFTGLSESLPPETVTNLLTRYFDRMVGCVHRYDGTMDKFMGDGMMVFFGMPRHMDNPCISAVKCAADMVSELAVLNEEFAAEGLPILKIGIGINYGKVVVGNIGSTERHNYSAIGDAVNVASRVEGLTKRLGKPIVFTDSVKAQLGSVFDVADLGEQAIRGHSAMRLWGVGSAGAIAALPEAGEQD